MIQPSKRILIGNSSKGMETGEAVAAAAAAAAAVAAAAASAVEP